MNGRSVGQVRAGSIGLVVLAVVGCGGGGKAKSTAGLPTTAAALPAGSGLVIFRRPGYSVGILPGKPERFASSFRGPEGSLKLVLYLARHGDAATEVGAVATTFDDAAIRSTITGAARSAGGTVADEARTTYEGLPARDARIAGIAGNKATFFLRVIGARRTGYVLGYTIKGNHTTPPAQYRAFLASLRID
jgi:hypothetical protein